MNTAIWWIRRDLRLADNPALTRALRHGRVVPLYIHAPKEEGFAAPGAASRWWLHHSLHALREGLSTIGLPLLVRTGSSALAVLRETLKECEADAVFWNRQYAPTHLERDTAIKTALREDGLHAESFNGSLLYEPWEIERDTGEPYKVFTPFWKACVRQGIDQPIEGTPSSGESRPDIEQGDIDALGLLPTIDWARGLREEWTPGEEGAWQRLRTFIGHALSNYKEARNQPGVIGTSRLSPHLHFGEISPRQIIRAVLDATGGRQDAHVQHFFSELGWREFGYHLLYHFPHTVDRPLNPRWEDITWPEVDEGLWQAWTRGQTGIPLVDAGMRELWHTGWMHNRVRMNAASLLVKNMLIPWQRGERWFWDTLVDADLANNVQGWQWTAGSGADAAPYFRIFNPVLQGERFDPKGDYVRRWVPELARLPDRWLHQPWEAPADVLSKAGVRIGRDYPSPIVDLVASRKRALELFAAIKRSDDVR